MGRRAIDPWSKERAPAVVIEPYEEGRLDAVVRLSLRAWEPVFDPLRDAMLPEVFRAFYRDDWRPAQRAAVESVCADPDVRVCLNAYDETRTHFLMVRERDAS